MALFQLPQICLLRQCLGLPQCSLEKVKVGVGFYCVTCNWLATIIFGRLPIQSCSFGVNVSDVKWTFWWRWPSNYSDLGSRFTLTTWIFESNSKLTRVSTNCIFNL